MAKSILNVSLDAGCATSPAAQQHRTRQYCDNLFEPLHLAGFDEGTQHVLGEK